MAGSVIDSELYWQAFEDHRYCDLTITCQGKDYLVHKAVVCKGSSVLNAMVNGISEGAKSNHIHLPEETQKVFSGVLEYLYRGKFTGCLTPESSLPLNMAKMYALLYPAGDKYGITGLKNYAKERYRTLFLHPDYIGKIDSIYFIKFFESIPAVYQLTERNDRGLRDIACQVMQTYSSQMFKLEAAVGPGNTYDKLRYARYFVMTNCPEFAIDVYEYMAESRPHYCDACLEDGYHEDDEAEWAICRGCKEPRLFHTFEVKYPE